jgi:tetratricopeptide (TPR) repeat protein
MNTKQELFAALTAAFLAPAAAAAQGPPTPPVTVRVVQGAPLPSIGNVHDFLEKLLALRLAEAGLLRVTAVTEEPPCSIGPSQSRLGQQGRATPPPPLMYSIVVEIRRRAASEEFDLDYGLGRIDRCVVTDLAHRSETFREADALEAFKVMSDVLAVVTKNDAVHIPTISLKMTVDGPNTASGDKIGNDLASFVLRSLNALGELDARLSTTVREAVDYQIDAHLMLESAATVTARFEIRPKQGQPITFPMTSPSQPESRLITFYQQVAKSVGGVIDDLRFTRATGLTQRLTELKADRLRTIATELLCVKADATCAPQPKEAEAVLLRLIGESPSEEAYEWLGVAQSGAGKFAAAGDSLVKAASSTSEVAVKLRVTLMAADAMYKAKRLDAAAAQYQTALKLSQSTNPPGPLDATAYLQWARALRMGADRVGAPADVLLSGLTATADKAVVAEFEDLIESTHGPGLTTIQRRLEAANAGITAPVMPALRRALVREQLSVASEAYSQSKYAEMDTALTLAESQVASVAADASLREWMARLRGVWTRDQRTTPTADDYARAETLFNEALRWMPGSERAKLALAVTYAYWPQGGTARLTRASQMLTDLTRAHVGGAAGYLRYANRGLKRNADTRTLLETAVKDDPTDRDALNALAGLCTDDLQAFDCALAAASKLEVIDRAASTPGTQLDLTEIEVLAGRHDSAAARVARIMTNTTIDDDLRTVGLFYQVWLAYVKAPGTTPVMLIDSWKAALAMLREKGKTVGWTFGGARAVLKDPNAARLDAAAVTQLTDMVSQMEKAG